MGGVVVGGGKGTCVRQGMKEGEEAVKGQRTRELLCVCARASWFAFARRKNKHERCIQLRLLMLPSLLQAAAGDRHVGCRAS